MAAVCGLAGLKGGKARVEALTARGAGANPVRGGVGWVVPEKPRCWLWKNTTKEAGHQKGIQAGVRNEAARGQARMRRRRVMARRTAGRDSKTWLLQTRLRRRVSAPMPSAERALLVAILPDGGGSVI